MRGLGFGLMLGSSLAFGYGWMFRRLVRLAEERPWSEESLAEARRIRSSRHPRDVFGRKAVVERLRVEEDHEHGIRVSRVCVILGVATLALGVVLMVVG